MAFEKGSKEAREWGKKVREAKLKKKVINVPNLYSGECAILGKTIENYFPTAVIKIDERENDFSVEITVREGDIRAFVVDKLTAKIETENHCKRIKVNMEGKSANTVTGTNLMTGVKEQMKKLPPELGKESEFFSREE